MNAWKKLLFFFSLSLLFSETDSSRDVEHYYTISVPDERFARRGLYFCAYRLIERRDKPFSGETSVE